MYLPGRERGEGVPCARTEPEWRAPTSDIRSTLEPSADSKNAPVQIMGSGMVLIQERTEGQEQHGFNEQSRHRSVLKMRVRKV